MNRNTLLYLDYNATTPCPTDVVEEMVPFFGTEYANPASAHLMGRKAAKAVEKVREEISNLVGCRAGDLFFTAGATESNNLVLQGLAVWDPEGKRIVTTSIEHKSILEPCRRLREKGMDVVEVPVTSDCLVDLSTLEGYLDNRTVLVSVQFANNETGTIQPIEEIVKICHARNVLVHIDAAQALGKVPLSLEGLDVDFASLSAHKCYGPKGIGALYVRSGRARNAVVPLLLGGGQELSIRPGTMNVPGIVGFGAACRLAFSDLGSEMTRIAHLRNEFEKQLESRFSGVRFIGSGATRLPGTTSVLIPGVPADALIARMPSICVGTGSACSSGALSPSHVLLACGVSRDDAGCVIRVSMGRFTTSDDVNFAIDEIWTNAEQILSFSSTSQTESEKIQVS